MELPRSRAISDELEYLESVGSTNDELVARGPRSGRFRVVVTLDQTAGRGRLDRIWIAPRGKALAVSVLVNPRTSDGQVIGMASFGWLPLIAGVAMTRAVRSLVEGHEVTMKWPNDVLVDGRKISGILAELPPGGDSVVIGAGLNLTLSEDELPISTATSLALSGVRAEAAELADLALSAYLEQLFALTTAYVDAGGDPVASGMHSAVSAACGTLGRPVRVQLPGASDLFGDAESIDESGRLLIRLRDGSIQVVAAGDVTHLRYE